MRSIADDPVYVGLENIDYFPKSVLEIGCGDGWRLSELKRIDGCKVMGIDPSKQAVQDGRKKYNIDLRVSTASDYNIDKTFDLIIFGFCLYLCSREELFLIVSKADRALKDKGLMVILDFYSKIPYSNDYKHYKGLKSYKMDCSMMFTWHPFYTMIYMNTVLKNNPDDYITTQILLKRKI